jgi:DNA segregation ATPase FtsK/SpoIIIE-like protein
MRPYVDIQGNKLDKYEVSAVIRAMIQANRTGPTFLQRRFGMGYGKAMRIVELLEDAGVLVPHTGSRPRTFLLKTEDAAINAALRQLKKGRAL